MSMTKGFKILELSDFQPEMESIHQNGWDEGLYVGFPQFKGRYAMLKGTCTDWIGYPQHGKTELLLEFLFFTSEAYGCRHLLYAPDIGRSIDIMIKLIHKHTGYTFKKKYDNFIDIKKAYESSAWLLEHFRILHKTDPKATMSPIEFWELAVANKKEWGLSTAVIDSWKDMRHDYDKFGGTYAPYLSSVLPTRNALAEASGLHFHTVVHPKNPTRDKKRKIYPPYPDDMEGGAQWNSSGKSIICVHRENWDTTVTDIYFRKIKPEQVGRASMSGISLNFNVARSRYYWIHDTTHEWVYAEKENLNHSLQPNKSNTMPIDFTESKKDDNDLIPF